MPHFREVNKLKNVKVLMISLDFQDKLDKVQKMADEKLSGTSVYLLDESYMDKISSTWSGALPATLLIEKNGTRHFYEQAFSRSELFTEIDKYTQ
jgi:hypothetical protein